MLSILQILLVIFNSQLNKVLYNDSMAGEDAKTMGVECEKHARLLRDNASLLNEQHKSTIVSADNLDREANDIINKASQLPDLLDEANRIAAEKRREAQRLRQHAGRLQREAQAYELEARHMDKEAVDLKRLAGQADKADKEASSAARNAENLIRFNKY